MTMTQTIQELTDVQSTAAQQVETPTNEIDNAADIDYDIDNGVVLADVLDPYFRPDAWKKRACAPSPVAVWRSRRIRRRWARR